MLLGAAVALGRHLIDDLERLEAWIDRLGPWGPIAFVGTVVVLTSLFVPESPLAMVGGLAFGLWWGTLWVLTAGLVGALVDFSLSRWLLRRHIEPVIDAHPRLLVLWRVADREGVRFHLLLRLTPVSRRCRATCSARPASVSARSWSRRWATSRATSPKSTSDMRPGTSPGSSAAPRRTTSAVTWSRSRGSP
jgi:hypothetical protein